MKIVQDNIDNIYGESLGPVSDPSALRLIWCYAFHKSRWYGVSRLIVHIDVTDEHGIETYYLCPVCRQIIRNLRETRS